MSALEEQHPAVARLGDLSFMDEVLLASQNTHPTTPGRLQYGRGRKTYDDISFSLEYEVIELMEPEWIAHGWTVSEHTVRKIRADYLLELKYTAPPRSPGGAARSFSDEIWKEATDRWKPCAITIATARPNKANATWLKRPMIPNRFSCPHPQSPSSRMQRRSRPWWRYHAHSLRSLNETPV